MFRQGIFYLLSIADVVIILVVVIAIVCRDPERNAATAIVRQET